MKRYESYKPSGVEFIGDIPKHWEIKKLKFLADVMGSNVDKLTKENEIPILLCNYTDVYKNDVITSQVDFMEATATELEIEKFLIQKDDVIITKDSETADDMAMPTYVEENFENVLCGYHLSLIRIYGKIKGKFLYYLFTAKDFNIRFELHSNGVTRFGLGSGIIKNTFIAYPTLQEQQKIANFLDTKNRQIDEFIKEKQHQITLLEEQKEAIINQAVTKGLDDSVEFKDSGIEWIGDIPKHWNVMKVTHVFDKIGSGTTPLTSNNDYYDNGIIYWVNSGDLNNSFIKTSSKLITQKAIDEVSSLKMYEKGALVIAMYGATIGKLGILDIQASVNQACCVLDSSDKMMNQFAFYWFLVNKQNIINFGIGGGQPNISQDIIKSLRIPTPSQDNQIEIIEFIEIELSKIDKIINQIQKEIDLIKEYKISLISEVVTGQIKVT